MLSRLISANKEMKKLRRPIDAGEIFLSGLEEKYHIDREKLKEIGIL
jgi:hypothetical protein